MKIHKKDDDLPEPDIPYDGDESQRKVQTLDEKHQIMRNSVRDFLLDHPKTNFFVTNTFIIIVSCVSAFVFAYGFLSFTNPMRVPFASISGTSYYDTVLAAYRNAMNLGEGGLIDENLVKEWYNGLPYNQALELVGKGSLVSGGASGLSQVLSRIISFTGLYTTGVIQENSVISILYICINIPFLIMAWLKIGKKFTTYTLFNILFSTIFLNVIPAQWCELTNIYDDYIARALAGGLCTGLSTGLALAIGGATGVVDIISLFFAERKSTSIGKYSLMVNVCTVVTYTLLHFLYSPSDAIANESTAIWNQGVNQTTMALYTVVYFYVSSKITDLINIKNKKVELQIITSDPNLSKILISGFPHACTIVNGVGGFTGTSRYVIYMVVSKSELDSAIKVMKQADSNCFVSVLATQQVYGKFYIKPIE